MNAQRESELAGLNNWITGAMNRGAVAIISHKNGDMDTIGSACALARILGTKARACGTHISSIAASILRETKSDFTKMSIGNEQWPRKLGGIIVVDAAGPSQIGIKLPDAPLCIIDHHSAGSEFNLGDSDFEIVWDTSSTAEIIQNWAEIYAPTRIDESSKRLLLAGIIADTGRFRHANASALASASRLVGDGDIDYSNFVEKMESVELNHSQRVAIANALKRVETLDVGDWFLSHTRAGTNEGIVARTLVTAGADIALVSRKVPEGTRITCRANRKATLSGVHLGRIMEQMVTRSGGEGGGHAGAAGWTGAIDSVDAVSGIISIIMKMQGD